MKPTVLSVTQLNEYVRKSLAADPMLRSVCIRGELSNFKRHFSGHWYFSLKDESAAINCAMFRSAADGVRFTPQNGQRVRLFGSVGLYSKTGSYQFYAEHMEQDGIGDLFLRYEALKEKLAAEGLFDASLKKPLPLLPRGIGIVTSSTGAVIHDIADVAWRRNPSMPLYLCPAKVQGEGAAEEIAAAIRLLDCFEPVDVIIVGRGGGSMEDLWQFNEELVARTIAKCGKPVVSAVGHETDFTIADFVADLRAPTPSAAAELCVPSRETLAASVDALCERASRAALGALGAKRLALSELTSRLNERSPAKRLDALSSRLRETTARLISLTDTRLMQMGHRLDGLASKLDALSPLATVARGYALVTLAGRPVTSAEGLCAGNALDIRLARGGVRASVTEVDKGI